MKDDPAIQRAMGYKPDPLSNVALAAAKCFVLLKEDTESRIRANQSPEFYRALIDIGREKGLHNISDGTSEYLRLVDAFEFLQNEGE